jgi:hypothetical protein
MTTSKAILVVFDSLGVSSSFISVKKYDNFRRVARNWSSQLFA